ncbi:MAG TPA: hypothetical protein VJO12_11460 [Stellaceae bacterium]|nr:hypothetical protein [Stellaceae bacterium]
MLPTPAARSTAGAAVPLSPATTRLRQLDREWDQEQALQFGAAAVGFLGAVLSLTVNSAFALLPAFAFATLAQYLIQGWCPPLILLTRMGLRSSGEIDRERYALTASVGDAHEPRLAAAAGGD